MLQEGAGTTEGLQEIKSMSVPSQKFGSDLYQTGFVQAVFKWKTNKQNTAFGWRLFPSSVWREVSKFGGFVLETSHVPPYAASTHIYSKLILEHDLPWHVY